MTRTWMLVASMVMLIAATTTLAQTAPAWEKENPIQPLPKSPLGVPKQLSELPNPPKPETVRLGRWLYYDKRISADGTVSCATCHRPENAFTEPTPVSTGVGGKKGGRKAPTFINLAWTVQPNFFWDGRAASLEEQAIGPMTNPVEMAMPDHATVVKVLEGVKGYKPYFKEAFGDDKITIDRVGKAIADFERTRLSGNSKWDKWQAKMDAGDKEALAALENADDAFGETASKPATPVNPFKDGPNLSAKAKWGHALFFGKAACNQCHLNFNLTDSLFHNLGVGWDASKKDFKDIGRYAISKKDEDKGAFKTPGLRDLSKRAPYMHDGSVKTLTEVVELYNKGGEKNPHLSSKIKPLNLSKEEAAALVAFMEALDGEGWQDKAPTKFPQ